MSVGTPSPARSSIGVARVTTAVAAVVYVTYLFTEKRLDENLRAAGVLAAFLIAAFADRYGARWPSWAALAAVMIGGIIMRPLKVPNHHHLLTYASAAFALSLTGALENRETLLRPNARWLIVVMWRYPEKPISHLSLWFFALTLSLLRQEMMFITTLCMVGLMACPPSLPRIRLGYAVLACVFASTVLKIG